MKAATRLIRAALVLACALAPTALHYGVIGPLLVASGHRGVAVLSLVGSVAWYVLWLRALPPLSPAQEGSAA